MGAGHYLLSRLMWDYDLDAETAEKQYYAGLYGKAGEGVKAYYDLLEDSLVKVFRDGPGAANKEPMIASFFQRYPGANNPGMYLAAYWPILPQMRKAIERVYLEHGKELSPDELQRLHRLIDHHNYTFHTVNAMVMAGRGLTGRATKEDRNSFESSKSMRDAAIAKIKDYSPYYAKLIADMDAGGHTGVLFGKKPTIEVRDSVGLQRIAIP